ncbi:MAG: WcaI family glycosyltransferase [Devosia sp.]
MPPASRALRLLLLGINYRPEPVGIAVYSEGLARWLTDRGHAVEVVAGQPYYPAWEVPREYGGFWPHDVEAGVGVTRVPLYVPKRPSGAKRILHHLSFAVSATFPVLGQIIGRRPDIVFVVAPSLVAAPLGWLAARLCGARAWLHVQDFEVDAALSTGFMNHAGFATRLARGFERWIMQRFDIVSSISPMMCARLPLKGVEQDRVVEFRNWASLEDVTPLGRPSLFREKWNISTPHVALYSGNIGAKQGMGTLIEVARLLVDNPDLTFVICGQGPERAALEASASDLRNVRFYDLQPRDQLAELVGLATIHLLPQLAGAADLVLPSKLNNMLASGVPVVATADKGTGLADEVESCGIVVPPGDATAMARAIERLMADDALRLGLGVAARQRALERWHPDAILAQLEQQLLELAASRSPMTPAAAAPSERA